MSALFLNLDPRRSLTVAIAWVFALVVIITGWLASVWIGGLSSDRVEREIGTLHRQYAVQLSNVLDNNLFDRRQWTRGIAGALAPWLGEGHAFLQRTVLDRFRVSLGDVEWIAFADTNGTVAAATDGPPTGATVRDSTWFVEGRKGPWVGGGRSIAPIGNASGVPPDDVTTTAIDFSAPVIDGQGTLVGVIVQRVGWQWVTRLASSLTEALRAGRPIESLVVNREGRVLLGPRALIDTVVLLAIDYTPGASGYIVSSWPDGVEYLAGYAVSDGVGDFPGLGWTVLVREPFGSAFAQAQTLARDILKILLLLGVIGTVLTILVMRRLTMGLAAIANAADEIRLGSRRIMTSPAGMNEVTRIGQSLQLLLGSLQQERERLQALNADLEDRVAARTREVERVSDENKYAAVVRERLRMARDMHDTLAHSMMALLTEIRVLKKVAERNPADLPAELANAEAAAEQGLREAREAITALRYNVVRDAGLGVALRQLAARFEVRRGATVILECDPDVDTLVDARAATVYRIIEEALRNVDRHAMANRVTIAANILQSDSGNTLQVRIEDDGVGFEPAAPRHGHFGLSGMKEQAALIDAALAIESAPDHGTTLILRVPL